MSVGEPGYGDHVLDRLLVRALPYTRTLRRLEHRMSATDDAVALINTETDDLAARVDAIIAGDANLDEATAAKLRPIADRLRSIAADPADPVPAPVDDAPVE